MPEQTNRAARVRVTRNRDPQRAAQDLCFEAAAERGGHEINLNVASEIQPVATKGRAARNDDQEGSVARRTAIGSGMACAFDDEALTVPDTWSNPDCLGLPGGHHRRAQTR